MKKVSNDFEIHRDALIKVLYLKGYKWLLFQNKRETFDFFGDTRY